MRELLLADHRPRIGIVERRQLDRRPVLPLRLAFVAVQCLVLNVVHTAKPFGAANGPVHRRGGDAERALDVVDQRQRITRRPVELVDEREDRQPVTPAHLEELAGLTFDAVRRVDDHHDAVRSNEGAIGVFAEIVMAGRVDQRQSVSLQLELERRGRDRDAALLLERHPVRRRLAPVLTSADGASEFNRAGVQQELFRQRRLARVGMRNNREGSPSRHLALEFGETGRTRGVLDVCDHSLHCTVVFPCQGCRVARSSYG